MRTDNGDERTREDRAKGCWMAEFCKFVKVDELLRSSDLQWILKLQYDTIVYKHNAKHLYCRVLMKFD